MDCLHNKAHEVNTVINYLEDSGRFSADIRIKCADCGKEFRFIGLPMGLDLNGAACSADGKEGRFAIYPAGEKVPGLNEDVPALFNIINNA